MTLEFSTPRHSLIGNLQLCGSSLWPRDWLTCPWALVAAQLSSSLKSGLLLLPSTCSVSERAAAVDSSQDALVTTSVFSRDEVLLLVTADSSQDPLVTTSVFLRDEVLLLADSSQDALVTTSVFSRDEVLLLVTADSSQGALVTMSVFSIPFSCTFPFKFPAFVGDGFWSSKTLWEMGLGKH